jgi:hypothetical protein
VLLLLEAMLQPQTWLPLVAMVRIVLLREVLLLEPEAAEAGHPLLLLVDQVVVETALLVVLVMLERQTPEAVAVDHLLLRVSVAQAVLVLLL